MTLSKQQVKIFFTVVLLCMILPKKSKINLRRSVCRQSEWFAGEGSTVLLELSTELGASSLLQRFGPVLI